MKILGITKLDEFADKHGDVRGQLAAWLEEVKKAEWRTPAEIKARYASSSFLADNHVIFNVKGKKYRLEALVSYKNQIILVNRIGTHAEYSKW